MNIENPKVRVKGLSAHYGNGTVLRDLSLDFPALAVSAIIGPSGCGKTTFVRCLNRLHELTAEARVDGEVWIGDRNIYAADVPAHEARRRVGMLFQKPNPFPNMSVRDNLLVPYRLSNRSVSDEDEVIERALSEVALWDELKDALDRDGSAISLGQQQRLCLARALALEPEVVLMDEPCAALDPIATARVEELIHQLSERYTIVIVTHNMQQAARVSDVTAFFYLGEIVEYERTDVIFTRPRDRRTEDYITGRFG